MMHSNLHNAGFFHYRICVRVVCLNRICRFALQSRDCSLCRISYSENIPLSAQSWLFLCQHVVQIILKTRRRVTYNKFCSLLTEVSVLPESKSLAAASIRPRWILESTTEL